MQELRDNILDLLFRRIHSIVVIRWVRLIESKIRSGYSLKPLDSFGEFDNFFLDLEKVQEILKKHHQTFLQLF